jgi:hypothetical protein
MSARILVEHLYARRAGLGHFAPMPTTTTFLTLSTQSSQASNAVWVPPSDTIASRRPPAKSRGYCRGFVVDHDANRVLVYESSLERDFACMLMADRRIAHIHDQPPAVTFRTPEGKPQRHTFDFLVTTTDNRRLAFAVKPSTRVERSKIEETLSLIREQVGVSFADRFLLRTEQHITKDRAYNARCILRARRARNEEDVEALRQIASSLNGAIRIADLVSLSKLGARGLNAVICLVDDGVLDVINHQRLGDLAFLRVAASSFH